MTGTAISHACLIAFQVFSLILQTIKHLSHFNELSYVLVGLAMGIRVLKGLSSMKALTVNASSKQTLQSSHSLYLTLDCYIIHLRERAYLFLFGVRETRFMYSTL